MTPAQLAPLVFLAMAVTFAVTGAAYVAVYRVAVADAGAVDALWTSELMSALAVTSLGFASLFYGLLIASPQP